MMTLGCFEPVDATKPERFAILMTANTTYMEQAVTHLAFKSSRGDNGLIWVMVKFTSIQPALDTHHRQGIFFKKLYNHVIDHIRLKRLC